MGYTIQEILAAPELRVYKGADVCETMNAFINAAFPDEFESYDYTGSGITGHVVAEAVYDAEAVVLCLFGQPFGVVSRAGRELSDVSAAYVTNMWAAQDAVTLFRSAPYCCVEKTGLDESVELKYWEGIPEPRNNFSIASGSRPMGSSRSGKC